MGPRHHPYGGRENPVGVVEAGVGRVLSAGRGPNGAAEAERVAAGLGLKPNQLAMLVSSVAKRGEHDLAVALAEACVAGRLGAVTVAAWNSFVFAAARRSGSAAALAARAAMERAGFRADERTYGHIVGSFAGEPDAVQKVKTALQEAERDGVAVASQTIARAVSVAGSVGDWDACTEFFRMMDRPDVAAFNGLLQCVAHMLAEGRGRPGDAARRAQEVSDDMQKAGVVRNDRTFETLVDVLARDGARDAARRVAEGMRFPKAATYTSVARAFATSGEFDAVDDLLRNADTRGVRTEELWLAVADAAAKAGRRTADALRACWHPLHALLQHAPEDGSCRDGEAAVRQLAAQEQQEPGQFARQPAAGPPPPPSTQEQQRSGAELGHLDPDSYSGPVARFDVGSRTYECAGGDERGLELGCFPGTTASLEELGRRLWGHLVESGAQGAGRLSPASPTALSAAFKALSALLTLESPLVVTLPDVVMGEDEHYAFEMAARVYQVDVTCIDRGGEHVWRGGQRCTCEA